MEVIYQKSQDIGTVTFNRPEVHNALSSAMLKALDALLDSVQEKVIIVQGAGDKAFISGADIQEMRGMNEAEWVAYCRLGRRVLSKLENFVTIAAVGGYAFGGGLEVALACDIIVASEKAQFALPEVKLGLIPSFSGIQRLKEAIGQSRAAAWLLTGAAFGAKEGQAMGLVHAVYPHDQLRKRAEELALQIAQNSAGALLGVKQVLHGVQEEEAVSKLCFAQEERKTRMDAFLKRKKHA